MAFAIVTGGMPVYELDLAPAGRREDALRAASFILHAALDMVDTAVWASQNTFLRTVDRHNEQLVAAYATPGGARMLVLHDGKGEEALKAFFGDIHELYAKALLNPFYAAGSRIESRDFDVRVRAAARRHLGYRGE